MATTLKEETRFALKSKRQDNREKLLLGKRQISSNFVGGSAAETLSNDDFSQLFTNFRKPNTPRCYEALKRLNSIFFEASNSDIQRRWTDSFFISGDGVVHSLVGVLTSQNLSDNRIQAEAGVCLSNLCCTNDEKQQNVLARLASPYFVNYLVDGVETTRISLALASLRGLGNLALEMEKNTKLPKALSAQNALEAIVSIIGHCDVQIREAALFALGSFLESFRRMKQDQFLGIAVKRFLLQQQKCKFSIYDVLNFTDKSDDHTSSISHGSRCLFIFSSCDGFPLPTVQETWTVLKAIDHCSSGEWQLQPLFLLWRCIGMFLNRTIDRSTVPIFDDRSTSIFLQLVEKFLRSEYVPLRKETLWIFYGFLHNLDLANFESLVSGKGRILSIFSSLVDVGKLTMCRDTFGFCLRLFHELLVCRGEYTAQLFDLGDKENLLSFLKLFLGFAHEDFLDADVHQLLNSLRTVLPN